MRAPQRVVVGEQPLDLLHECVGLGQVDQADGPAADLVFIGRSDAAFGRADAKTGVAAFADAVEFAMQRQDEGGIFGDAQRLGAHRHALPGELIHFDDEMVRIDDDAVADDAELAPHHARGQQRQFVADAVDHQRVAGIVTALIAHHHVGALAQPVHDLAFALVAPLGADHDDIRHC